MTRAKVKKSGFVYELAGSNATLTPITVTSYFPGAMDVQGTSDQSHESFSGRANGGTMTTGDFWDKTGNITRLFSDLEAMLKRPNWQPQRTLILLLRFDEDALPERGAGTITQFLTDKYGSESRVLVVREGDPVLELLAGDMCECSTSNTLHRGRRP
jgi:hypothetical protein